MMSGRIVKSLLQAPQPVNTLRKSQDMGIFPRAPSPYRAYGAQLFCSSSSSACIGPVPLLVRVLRLHRPAPHLIGLHHLHRPDYPTHRVVPSTYIARRRFMRSLALIKPLLYIYGNKITEISTPQSEALCIGSTFTT